MWPFSVLHFKKMSTSSPRLDTALPPRMVLKLNKALYGLKQSPREWNATLDKYLCHDLKMTEQCNYVRFTDDRSQYLIVGVYVDDCIIAGSTQARGDTSKQQLLKKFQCKDLGALDMILNMEITRTSGVVFFCFSLCM